MMAAAPALHPPETSPERGPATYPSPAQPSQPRLEVSTVYACSRLEKMMISANHMTNKEIILHHVKINVFLAYFQEHPETLMTSQLISLQ